MEKSPALALMITNALAKKGKVKSSQTHNIDDKEKSEDSYREHLLQISEDLISAIHDKDPEAVADLLQEAFECLDSSDDDSDEEEKY